MRDLATNILMAHCSERNGGLPDIMPVPFQLLVPHAVQLERRLTAPASHSRE